MFEGVPTTHVRFESLRTRRDPNVLRLRPHRIFFNMIILAALTPSRDLTRVDIVIVDLRAVAQSGSSFACRFVTLLQDSAWRAVDMLQPVSRRQDHSVHRRPSTNQEAQVAINS